MIKKAVTFLLKRLGMTAGGPVYWLASFVLEKVLVILWAKLKLYAAKTWDYLVKSWKNKSIDRKAERYEETLQDGATEQEQIDATTDLLNGTSKLHSIPKDNPPAS